MSDSAAIRDRLEEHAIPLDGVDPTTDSADLDPLVYRLRSATVIGLGESAHGTSEFPRLKHRLVRRLVRELDADLLALEKRFPEMLSINDYVLGRTDDRGAVHDAYGLDSDPWLGGEWLAVVDWLRAHNDEVPVGEAVPVYGFTKTYGGAPADALVDFLDRADEAYLREVRDSLAVLQRGLFDEAEWEVREDRLRVARELLPDLRGRLTEHRDELVAATSETDWMLAGRQIRMLEQASELQAVLDDPDRTHREVRDRFMSENLAWIVEHVGAERVVVSAGNGHITDGPSTFSSLDAPMLGSHLRERYGDDYYAMAVDFGHGSVRTHRPASGGEGLDLVDFEFPPPDEMTTGEDDSAGWGTWTESDLADPQLHAVLRECEFETAALDVDTLTGDEVLTAWLEEPHLLHGVGSRHWPSYPARSISVAVLPRQFDGLIYVDEVHPPTATGDE